MKKHLVRLIPKRNCRLVADVSCIACGSTLHRSLGQPKFPQSNNTKYSVIECVQCELQRAYPMPTSAELDDYYLGSGNYGISPTHRLSPVGLFRKYVWHPWRNSTLVHLVERFVPEGTVLDYGFGEGRLLRALKRSGKWHILGADYSKRKVEQLRKEGFKVEQANDLSQLALDDGTIDCVLASHVIEHLTAPLSFLSLVNRLLRPRGVLVAAVPSRTSVRARLGSSHWHYVDPPNHQWSFKPMNFQTMLQRAGFNCEFLQNNLLVNELLSVFRKGE